MQGKLDDLIDKTALTLKVKERADELALKEREVMSLRETINDLRNKYLSIQNQVFSLEEIQRNDAQRISRMTNQIQEYESLLKEQTLKAESMPIRRIGRMIFESLREINIPSKVIEPKRKRVRNIDSQTEDYELTFTQLKVSIKGKTKKQKERPPEEGDFNSKEPSIEEQPIRKSRRQDKPVEEDKNLSTIRGSSRKRDKEFKGDKSFKEMSL
jgi:chromosome segregation ATPase